MLEIKIKPRYKPPTAKRVKKRNTLAEFSKRVIAALIVVWFVGALVGISVVAVQTVRGDMTVNLSDLLVYIGAPMTGGIVTYLLKSAYENKEKIKQGVQNYAESQNEIDQP